jgi:hypothetical protein
LSRKGTGNREQGTKTAHKSFLIAIEQDG